MLHCRRFVVGIAGFIVAAGVSSSVFGGADEFPSPLRISDTASEAWVTPLALDVGGYRELAARERVRLTDFALGEEQRVEVELQRLEVFAEDALIVKAGVVGETMLPRPDVVLLAGRIASEPGSHVFLGLSPHGSNGYVRHGGQTYVISSGRPGTNAGTGVYNLSELPRGAIAWKSFHCAADEIDQPVVEGFDPGGGGAPSSPMPGPKCRVVHMAVETDWEFNSWLFGGDEEAAAAYATQLLGAVAEIYLRDIETHVLVKYLRIWETSGDPWDAGDTQEQLYQFSDYWQAEMTGIERHVAHFLSGRNLGGGIAFRPGLCQGPYAYSVAANLNGYFPYPLQDHHKQNWDPYVCSHELGHNFGAIHTHEQSPPIDGCAWGDCVSDGTIMSYCHLCDGGLKNIVLAFHPITIEDIFLYIDGDYIPCDIGGGFVGIYDHPDGLELCVGDTAVFAVEAGGEEPLSYQWRKDGQEIPGAVEPQYVIEDAQLEDSGAYDVVVTNLCGSKTTDPALLAVGTSLGADLNCDGEVDVVDLLQLLGAWGPCEGCEEDLDGSGVVDVLDLLQLLGSWGAQA